MTFNLSPTQKACLEWLADDSKEFGGPGGRRTLHALRERGYAELHNGRWRITDLGRIQLGPIFSASPA